MAPPERVLAVDFYGSAVVFEEFERVIVEGGSRRSFEMGAQVTKTAVGQDS